MARIVLLFTAKTCGPICGARAEFKTVKVSYHKALKRILGVPYWYSNHDVCNYLNFKTFDNLVNLNVFKLLFQLKYTKSPCMIYLKYYLMNDSELVYNANQTARAVYGFSDILDNDFDAISSCVRRVQSSYVSSIPYEQLLNRTNDNSALNYTD